MACFYFGQIIYAPIDNGFGDIKNRPAVIIDGDGDYAPDEQILVIPISKSSSTLCPCYHVCVHHSRDKNSCRSFNQHNFIIT